VLRGAGARRGDVRVLDQFGLEVAFDRLWTGELERRAGDSED
jgi:hypothetical protein